MKIILLTNQISNTKVRLLMLQRDLSLILKVPNIYKLITIISSFKGAALVLLGNFLNAIQTLELSYKMENILLNY